MQFHGLKARNDQETKQPLESSHGPVEDNLKAWKVEVTGELGSLVKFLEHRDFPKDQRAKVAVTKLAKMFFPRDEFLFFRRPQRQT